MSDGQASGKGEPIMRKWSKAQVAHRERLKRQMFTWANRNEVSPTARESGVTVDEVRQLEYEKDRCIGLIDRDFDKCDDLIRDIERRNTVDS